MYKQLFAAALGLAVALSGTSVMEAHAKTTFVTIGTGGITGVYYPTGGAIAKIVNKQKDKYNIRATVESTGASVFNINAIMSGDLEFVGFAPAAIRVRLWFRAVVIHRRCPRLVAGLSCRRQRSRRW